MLEENWFGSQDAKFKLCYLYTASMTSGVESDYSEDGDE